MDEFRTSPAPRKGNESTRLAREPLPLFVAPCMIRLECPRPKWGPIANYSRSGRRQRTPNGPRGDVAGRCGCRERRPRCAGRKILCGDGTNVHRIVVAPTAACVHTEVETAPDANRNRERGGRQIHVGGHRRHREHGECCRRQKKPLHGNPRLKGKILLQVVARSLQPEGNTLDSMRVPRSSLGLEKALSCPRGHA